VGVAGAGVGPRATSQDHCQRRKESKEKTQPAAPLGSPIWVRGSRMHGGPTIAVGGVFSGAPFATLGPVDWVDVLIIGLMVLAAVHGLRLGALVQLLTFGGFFLGLLLGTLVWVPLLRTPPHDDTTRAVVVVVLVMLTASLFGYTGRVLGTYSNLTLRRHHLGQVDSVLGVGVAVVAVLLSVWLVAAVISSPSSRFTSLDAAVSRSDILHSIDRILPQAPSIFSDLQTFLNNQGFPQVFSTLTPPSTPSVSTPTNAETRALADPALDSTVKILGTACANEQEGSGFVVGPGLVATNAHVVAGEGDGDTQVVVGGNAYGATPVYFDPSFDIAVLRTDAPLGPALTIDPGLVPRGTQGAVLGYPEDGPLTIDPAGVTEEITAIGKDIYNNGSVTRGVYALDATVLPGNSGGPLLGPGGQVIGVVFSRSTVYQNVGYALTSPGVLARVQQAELNHSTVSTGPCISG
jgi:S1-C subfamily serine protease